MNMFKAALVATTLLVPSLAQAFPIATGGEGFKVIVLGTGDVIATYQGNSASYSNDLYLEGRPGVIFNNHASAVGSWVNLGSFAVGTELVFRLFVNNTGDSFYTGPASRNDDGNAHARVQSEWMPGETLVSFEDLYNGPFDYNDLSFSFTNTGGAPGAVPEPSSWALMITGFGLLGGAMRRRTAQTVSFA